MAKELNETFPGIEAVNDFYTPYYMKEYFPDEVKNASAPWKQLPPEERPARLLKDMRQSFTEVINNNENDLFPAERVRNFIDGMLAALGYTQEGNQTKDEGLPDRISGKSVPVHYQVNDSDGAPRLQVLVSLSDSAEAGVLENPIEDGSGKDGTSCEEYARMLLADFDEPARWILLMGLHQIALIDRRKWNDKKCMLFDLDEIFSRHQDHVYTAMAVLLRRDSLCPNKGDSLLDTFDDTSAKNAVEVSDNLRSALRECVEILGNEVIHDWTCNKGRSIDEIDAGDLTVQALRYMYRLLFLLFIEAKPSLGYAPMKSDIYRTGYSLDSLRDIAEQMRGRMDEAGDSTYLADTLRRLDDLVFNGYPKTDEDFKGLAGKEAINAVFMVPPLKAHIFDPERTALIEHAALRDSVMLRIIDLMSVTKTGKGVKRRQRISYAALGISQMGAVYEALLSYRGFIAKEKLYEVKRAKDSYDPLKVGYFVPERELDNYSERTRPLPGQKPACRRIAHLRARHVHLPACRPGTRDFGLLLYARQPRAMPGEICAQGDRATYSPSHRYSESENLRTGHGFRDLPERDHQPAGHHVSEPQGEGAGCRGRPEGGDSRGTQAGGTAEGQDVHRRPQHLRHRPEPRCSGTWRGVPMA